MRVIRRMILLGFVFCLVALVSIAPTRTEAGSRLCKNNPVDYPHNKGCSRHVYGWDITGSATKQVLAADTPCNCAHLCAVSNLTCASYVWKFDINATVRACNLYSNFVLPYDVQMALSFLEDGEPDPHVDDDSWHDTHSNFNVDPFDTSYPSCGSHCQCGSDGCVEDCCPVPASHTQEGQLVPQCLMPDGLTADPHCVSGMMFVLGNGRFIC